MAEYPQGRFALSSSRSGVRLEFAFVARLKRGHRVHTHTHGALEIVYYVEGGGTTTVGEDGHRILRNTFAIVPAGIDHDQVSRTDMTAVCVGLTGSGLEDIPGLWHDRDGRLRRPLERLFGEISARQPEFEIICEGLALMITGLARRIAVSAAATSPKRAIVERALELISERDGAVSVRELSEELYISRDYLRHLFAEFSSQSPLRHIISARIERARDLLADQSLSIAQVADRCGFDNPYYFSRLFRQQTGQTPSAYRKTLA